MPPSSTETPTPSQSRTLPPVPHVSWHAGALASVTLMLLIALAELDRLSSQIVSPVDHRTHGFGSLVGPLALVELNVTSAEKAWLAGIASDPAWGFWLRIFVGLDLVLIAVWALVWWRLYHAKEPKQDLSIARRIVRAVLRTPSDVVRSWRTRSSRRQVVLVGLSWVLLNLLADLAALALTVWSLGWIAWLLALLTIGTWALFAAFSLAGLLWLWKDTAAEPARTSLVRWARAVRTQRLSLIVIVPLAGLALIPRGDISDQLPDVQRAWVDSLAGRWEAVVSLLALVAVAFGLFVLGRLRTDHVLKLVPGYGFRAAEPQGGPASTDPPPRELAPLWLWFVLPALLGGLAVGLLILGRGSVDLVRLLLFCTPSLVIGVVSLRLRHGRFSDPSAAPVPPTPDLEQYRRTARMGDAFAISLLALGGLGLVRSYVAPVVLGLAAALPGHVPGEVAKPPLGIPLFVLMVGVAGALLPWLVPALQARVTRRWGTDQPGVVDSLGAFARLVTPGYTLQETGPIRLRFVLLSIAIGLVVAVWPTVGRAGVVATALVSLAAAALVIGAIQVTGQDRHPPEIFWLPWLRRSATPVVSLALAGLLFATLAGSGAPAAQIHLVEVRPQSRLPGRPPLGIAFEQWLAAQPGCGSTHEIGGREVKVRPLMLVAAQGGGIRAAYWTTTTLTMLQGGQPCRNAFLASGASGGAVGLTITRFAPADKATGFAEQLSSSTALAEGTHGLLIRDQVFAATGVGVQLETGWTDRAAAIEKAWIDATDGVASPLAKPYLSSSPPAPSSPTGYLVLGSTSVGTGCRVLLSQIELPAPDPVSGTGEPGSAPVPCDGATAPAPRSYDLFAAYGSGAQPTCVGDLDAATVALLASRFPYVTPSGVVGPCGPWRADQVVDGGYEENTGLGAVVDLGPAWFSLVREHNDTVLRGQGGTLVVPMVVFLTNGTGSDLLPSVRPITQELFVPPVALLRGMSSQNEPNALLQRTVALTRQLPWTVPGVELPAALQTMVVERPRTFVVFPATRPSVTAPLGWTLSAASRDALRARAVEQLGRSCQTAGAGAPTQDEKAVLDLLCDRGYGTLGDASALMGELLS